MNEFTILAQGPELDVDACLLSTTLQPTSVWRTGDATDGGEITTSGLSVELGQGESHTLEEQFQIATEFLKANADALRELGKTAGVQEFVLSIPVRIDPDLGCTPLTFPSALLKQAIEVGVHPTFFITVGKAEVVAPVAEAEMPESATPEAAVTEAPEASLPAPEDRS